MKKILALMLVGIMMATSIPMTVFAENSEDVSAQIETPVEESAVLAETEQQEWSVDTNGASAVSEKSSFSSTGKIETEIHFSQPMKTLKNVNLWLSDDAGQRVSVILDDVSDNKKELKFGNLSVQYRVGNYAKGSTNANGETEMLPHEAGQDIAYAVVNFYGLPAGQNYELSVSGAGVFSKTADVELVNTSKRVVFSDNGIVCGDVTNDGVVDGNDYDLVLEALGTGDYDLNQDGETNLVDLVYVQDNYSVTPDTPTIEETDTIIDPNVVVLEADKANPVKVEGSIGQLFAPASETTETVKFMNTANEVSEEEPVVIPLNVETSNIAASQIRIVPDADTIANGPKAGSVIVEYADSSTETVPFNSEDADVLFLTDDPSNGTIVIDLNRQTPIKKVTIRVTATNAGSSNLVEISKVEFLNNTKDKIQEPADTIPTGLQAVAGDETVTLSWDRMPNVTGYEVKETHTRSDNGQVETSVTAVDTNTIEFSKLTNYTTYTFSVRSVNGEWKSGYSQPVEATPVAASVPSAPENVTLTGKYRQIALSWKAMKNTKGYNVYYREEGEATFTKKDGITGTSTTLDNLKDKTTYEIYLTGWNDIGEGAKTAVFVCTTTETVPPEVENYKRINVTNGESQPTAHIEKVEYPGGTYQNEFDVVDNDYSTSWYLNSWDAGGYNPGKPSPIITFDQAYEMDYMNFVTGESQPWIAYVKVRYWDEENKMTQIDDASIKTIKSANGNSYYQVRFNRKIKAKKIQVNTALYWAGNTGIRYQEMMFYYYDSLSDDVDALFKDDLHVELNDNVTAVDIDTLEARANTTDSVSGEYHPDRESILRDLQLARDILSETAIDDSITVDQNVFQNKDNNLQFSFNMNDYQPLGVAVRAGDKINVYVGNNTSDKELDLVYTQYHAEAAKWTASIRLKRGKNEITIPTIGGEDSERGGSLYIRYLSSNPSNQTIKVRVAGGVKIPYLNLTEYRDRSTGEWNADGAKTAIQQYVADLETYIQNLPTLYPEGSRYAYDPASSVLNSTEIMTSQTLLSLPATAVYDALSGDKTEQLWQNAQAMEQMMDIIYHSKGLSRTATDQNHWPYTRINIRYMRMFEGAFMYASGAHIGVEYGSTGALVQGKPHTKQDDGTWAGGDLYGWGIAHEIGHVTDQKNMVYSETSNNIVSQLLKTFDEKEAARADYPSIYKKVTSGTKGLAGDVFTQLGMFWQLHLAYDSQYNDVDNADAFYGRMYRQYRSYKAEDNPDKDNLLIRMASDAAQKDLTAYFEKWGLTATEATKAYVSKYDPEERAIYYLNDDARHYQLAGKPEMARNTTVKAGLDYRTDQETQANQVTLTLNVSKDPDRILGYEIIRNGETIGFVNAASEGDTVYTDVLTTLNNRVVNYEVVAYDYYLNTTDTFKLNPIKIEYDGSLAKNNWTLTSNMTSEGDEWVEDFESGSGVVQPALEKLYNNDYSDVYTGHKKAYAPQITIDMNRNTPIVGFKYTAALTDGQLADKTITGYKIEVSEDGSTWQEASKGTFAVTPEQASQIIYFSEKDQEGYNQMITYNARFVRITATANNASGISGAEFDVIAPPGDNIDLTTQGIGILKNDFQYGEGAEDVIKAGALIFTGSYRGHPGFNTVLLKDENNKNVVGKDNAQGEGTANQILLAKIPPNDHIGEISEGSWIYWIDKEDLDLSALPKTVRAELYRVDDMETNAGQRLTSDSYSVSLPSDLPEIDLTNIVIPE